MSVESACQTFVQSRKSLVLSTLSQDGELETSVVPFVRLNQTDWAIWVSELSTHTQNLQALTQQNNLESGLSKPAGLVSGLLLADESDTPQIFARERMSVQCKVFQVEKGTEVEEVIYRQFSESFGEVVEVLKTLPDFHFFKLELVRGRYIKGFGAAYAFEGPPCRNLDAVKGK